MTQSVYYYSAGILPENIRCYFREDTLKKYLLSLGVDCQKKFQRTAMHSSLISILFAGTISLVVSGCGTKQQSIDTIEQTKHAEHRTAIRLGSAGGHTAYLDSDDNLRYICLYSDEEQCGYYTDEKHDYTEGRPDEEAVIFSESGYYPPISPSASGIQCGKGSLFGWLAIFPVEPFAIADYTAKHPRVCNSRFAGLESTQMAPRIMFGLLTFMTPLLTGGTMHTEKFDREAFFDAVYNSNLESYRTPLLETIRQRHLRGGIDTLYLDPDDVEDDLEDKYDALLSDRSKKSALLILDARNKDLLAAVVFTQDQNLSPVAGVSEQIRRILSEIAGKDMAELTYDDVLAYIPPEVPLPTIPPAKKLIKDEFETQAEFDERVREAIRARELHLKALQRDYSLAVYERNSYIDDLQHAYSAYLQEKSTRKQAFLDALGKNMPLLSKVLFLENVSGFEADGFRYDAEHQKLYFTLHSRHGGYRQDVVAKIPPESAKRIKREHRFAIIPQIDASDHQLTLEGFEIVDTDSDDAYATRYTNVNFRPETVSLRIRGTQEHIDKELSNYFENQKQPDRPIVDTSKKEIWYIDVVKHIDARIPKWFSKPMPEGKIVGYGEGETLKEAKMKARDELAFMKRVKISSRYSSSQEFDNFKSFKEIKSRTQQDTDTELSANEYRLYRQEQVDGIWYVGFEYVR